MKTHKFSIIEYAGIAIIILSVLSFLMLLLVSLPDAIKGHLSCQLVSGGCTIFGHFSMEAYVGFISTIVIMLFGIWVLIKSRKEMKTAIKTHEATKEVIQKLSDDEKKIYDHVIQHDGIIFQNEIVKDLGYSKVKTSRILDKLETKGLIERRRRGMANLVVLKK
ncbi:MarR family transcriptional regulator [archaeon]|nr:MarR family transcriptional regulator [archaeon]